MASAATRAKEAWQPRGGYVDPRSMKTVRFEGARPFFPAASENVHPSVVETAVRRLLALTAGDTVEGAFSECVVSALVVGERDDALRLRADIRGLDDASVASACRLSAYEAALEAGIALHAEDVTRMRPNAATLANVRTMVESASGFLKGRRLVARAPLSPGGFTDLVDSGCCDFMTKRALWDVRTSDSAPGEEDTLRLAICLLLGLCSRCGQLFRRISELGVVNPRLLVAYAVGVEDIPPAVMREIGRKAVGVEDVEFPLPQGSAHAKRPR